MTKTIGLLGAFDTKGPDFAFVRDAVLAQGCAVLTINVGVLGVTDLFPIDIPAAEVVQAAGADLAALRAANDRGAAMSAMAAGAAIVAKRLHAEGRIDALLSMGGTGGTSIAAAAMRALPFGVPKVCVSTAAGGDVSAYVGASDIVMIPSVADVAGVNRITRIVYARAAGAVCGMARAAVETAAADKPVIVASMFGNTTECVGECARILGERGHEVLVFHAVGTGGRAMEALVREGLVDGVLDITTTEWADELCGGVFSAGPERLDAPGQCAVPHLIVPGCVDMVNFGPMSTVPQRFRDAGRLFYEWNPSVTLMRTAPAENRELGRIFAEKANAAKGPVAVLIPRKGVSILDGDGQMFCDREADEALFDELKKALKPEIPVVELDCNINDKAFAAKACELMLGLMKAR